MPGPGLRGSLGTISITMSVVDRASKRINNIAGNLDKMEGKLGGAARKARTVGSAMTAMGALFLQVSNQMAEMMEPMETALARASAMAAGTETKFEDLREAAFDVGKSLTMSSEKAAKAMYWVASAGVSEMEKIKAVAKATGRLSKIHGEMWPEAAKVALSSAKIFGVELRNINEITGVMNKTISSSLMNLHDLGNTMKYAGPVAKTMGWNFESLSSAIASMANMGVRGSKAGCYDEETEVLTREGFKYFKNLEGNEQIATLNKETSNLEYQKPTKLVKEDFSGKLYRVKNKYLDIKVTSDHWMYIQNQPYDNHDFKRVKAKNIKGKAVRYKRNADWNKEDQSTFILDGFKQNMGNYDRERADIKINMDLWMKFLGWFLAEGWTKESKGGHYTIGISQKKDSVFWENIKEILDSLPFNYNYSETNQDFIMNNQQLFRYLKPLGKSYEKYIPKEIKNSSSRQLKLLLKEYLKGDGDGRRRNRTAWTSSSKLRDDLEEIILKIGWSCSHSLDTKKGEMKNKIKGRQIEAKHNTWAIYVNREHGEFEFCQSKNEKSAERADCECHTKEEWEDYSGKIYCAIVPNHVMFIRRKGKTYWCGNTTIRAMLTRLAKPTEDAIDVMDKLGVQFFNVTDKSKEAKEAMGKWETRLDSTQSELKETKEDIERLQEAQEDLSLREQKLRLRTERIRLEAHRENRDMNQEEMDQMDELKTKMEGLSYRRDVLSYQENKASQRKDELKEKQSKENDKLDEARQKYKEHLGALKSFDDIVAQLAVSMKDFGKKQKAAYLKTLFGRRAVSGLMAVLSKTEEVMENISVDTMSFGDAVETLTTQKGGAISKASQLYQGLTDEREAIQEGNKALMISDDMYQRVNNNMSIFNAQAKVTNQHLATTREQMGKMNSSFVTAIQTTGRAKSTFFGFLTKFLTLLNNINPLLVAFLASMVIIGPTISTVAVTIMMAAASVESLTAAVGTFLTTAAPIMAVGVAVFYIAKAFGSLKEAIVASVGAMSLALAALEAYQSGVGVAAAATSVLTMAQEEGVWAALSYAVSQLFAESALLGIAGVVGALALVGLMVSTVTDLLAKAEKGGLVAKTGVMEVHKGEVIRPSGWKEETTPTIENLTVRSEIKGRTAGATTDVGGINIEVNTGDIKGIEDVEKIGDTIGERVRDSITRSRKI